MDKKKEIPENSVNSDSTSPDLNIHDANYLAPDFFSAISVSEGYELKFKRMEELIERDNIREKDGFPRKVKLGKLIKPGKDGKVIIVPATVEEKFYHSAEPQEDPDEEKSTGGSGDGEEGEVLGEQPLRPEGQGAGTGAGDGDEGMHELEATAYDLGKVLTDKFELPNLKHKGKRKSLTSFSYELTDRNRRTGQILDKKATLRQIIKTNIALGNIQKDNIPEPEDLILSPNDRIYRTLSRERDYESEAVVFFVRDYSGSMSGQPTELVVSQHVLIYSWLTYQYENRVKTRFILHDTEAREVADFNTYYNSTVAGGTKVASAYRLVNNIVREESLAEDYNIYIFHGTDGDDWDTSGRETLPELEKMTVFANRIGITVAASGDRRAGDSELEAYIHKSGFLEKYKERIRMGRLSGSVEEDDLIEGIKHLISE